MKRSFSEKKKTGEAVIAVDSSSSDDDMEMSVEEIAPTSSNGLVAPSGKPSQATVDLCSPPTDKKCATRSVSATDSGSGKPNALSSSVGPSADRAARRLARLDSDMHSSGSSSSSTSSKRHCPASRQTGSANLMRASSVSSESSVGLGGFSDLNFGSSSSHAISRSRSSSSASCSRSSASAAGSGSNRTTRRSPRRTGRSAAAYVDPSHGDFDDEEYDFGDGVDLGHGGGGFGGVGAGRSRGRRGLDYYGGGDGAISGAGISGLSSGVGGDSGSRIFAEVAAARAAMAAAEAEHAELAAEQRAMSRAVSASNQAVLGSQDYEFLQSLEADKQKKREREMKQEVEAERAALADALALSTAMHAKSEEERAAAARAEAAALLPPEPSKNGGEACVTVCFRLPPNASVSRLERRFNLVSDTVGTLLAFLRSREELSGVAAWSLRQGHGAQHGGPLGTSTSTSTVSTACSSSSNTSGASAVFLSSLGLGTRALLLVQDDDA